MFGNGTETRDFIYVGDVARAITAVVEKALLKGEVYNVATGIPHTTLKVAQLVASALGVDPDITFTGSTRSGDPVHWCADIGKLSGLDFTPRFSLKEGIAKTVDWYLKEIA